MNNRKLFNDKEELESSMFNYLNLQKEKQGNSKEQNNNFVNTEFQNETIKVIVKDYYFSNVIVRSSTSMIVCNNSKLNLKFRGIVG